MPADVWVRVAVFCLLVLGLAALRAWDRSLLRRQKLRFVVPQVKEYPPGCLCVYGALLDNPACPHHGGDHEWTA